MLLLILLLGAIALGTATETSSSIPIVEIDADNKLNSVNEASIDLNLSGLGLKSIAQNAFENCTDTRTLNLSNNSIGELPQSVFAPLVNLEHLSLANNDIKKTKNAFLGLDRLKSLNMSNNPLREVLHQQNFAGLTKSCDIFVSGLKRVRYWTPSAFGKRKKHASVIEVNNQPRQTCPKMVETMTHDLRNNLTVLESEIPSSILVKACMEGNKVKSIETFDAGDGLPMTCRRAKIVENFPRINFYESRIESFEKGWYQIQNPSFGIIHLALNRIADITAELLNDLPWNIKSVNLERNDIKRVRKNVIVNHHLRALDLSHNGLRVIEEDALANTNLTHLNLESNKIMSLRFAMSLPTSLLHLNLESNYIGEIPADTFANLKNLLRVILSHNGITELQSRSLKGLESLQNLTMTDAHLEIIQPGAFRDLKNLGYLSLFRNRISILERGVFEGLVCLDFLDLSSNTLTTLSKESLEGLTENLHTLSLESNKIREIVEGTFDLPYLRELHLNDNNISRIEKGAARHLGDHSYYFGLTLSGNPLKRLENGALAGLMNNALVDIGNDIEVIQGGVFDDV